MPVARGPRHAGDGQERGNVLVVVDVVEDRLVIVGHVHPDQVQVPCAHGHLLSGSHRLLRTRFPEVPVRYIESGARRRLHVI